MRLLVPRYTTVRISWLTFLPSREYNRNAQRVFRTLPLVSAPGVGTENLQDNAAKNISKRSRLRNVSRAPLQQKRWNDYGWKTQN